jgi:IS1 family transposase
MYNIGEMNKLSLERRTQVIKALVEGNSIRATCRMTDTAKGTVIRLLRDVGKACAEYQDKHLKDLPCKHIQCDEIWSFCYSKQKNIPENKQGKFGYGDVWTWIAIDADTKLAPSWRVGLRDAGCAYAFMADLKSRLANRVQLTSDGHKLYLWAVEDAFGAEVDYAMLVKLYGAEPENERHYSPAKCISVEPHIIQGNPDPAKISTSYAERQNLTMRMNMRRFTRLTNAFSKKVGNLGYAVALHFMYYNFARPHKTLTPKASIGVTPAMASGITNRIWTIEDIVSLIG